MEQQTWSRVGNKEPHERTLKPPQRPTGETKPRHTLTFQGSISETNVANRSQGLGPSKGVSHSSELSVEEFPSFSSLCEESSSSLFSEGLSSSFRVVLSSDSSSVQEVSSRSSSKVRWGSEASFCSKASCCFKGIVPKGSKTVIIDDASGSVS